MEHNENNNQNMRRGDHLQPLPPGLEWDNMKDGILDKMHSIELAESSPKNDQDSRKGIWLFLSLFIALSFTFCVGLMLFYQAETTEQTLQAYDIVQIPDSGTIEYDSAAFNSSEPKNQQVISEESVAAITGSANINDLPQTSEESELYQGPDESNRYRREKERLPESQALNADLFTSTFSEPDPIGSSQHHSEPADLSLRPLADVPNIITWIHVPITKQLLPVLEDQQLASTWNLPTAGSEEIDSSSIPTTPRSNALNQLVLEGGVNVWTEGYGNSLSDRDQYETPIPSFQLQGSYMKGLKGGYFIMAGLQYQQLESRLDYRNTIEDYQITLEDTIVEIRKNSLTGEETLIRGDVVQSVRAERNVRHYNKTQLFKTSLALGKQWRFKDFQTDVYLGGALNGIVQNQGRMFFDNEIIDYKGTSTPTFRNQWTVDGVAGARVHYFLYKRMSITTGIQAQRSLMNWSIQEGVRLYPLSVSLQVGVSYSL